MKPSKPRRSLAALALTLALATSSALAQAAFADRTMKASVGNTPFGRQKSSGTLTLASSGVSFDSADFVFTLPADDILSVETKGARDGFLTFVIDNHSKFLAAYPSLLGNRFNSIGEDEHLLIVSLDSSEPVDVELTRAKAYQVFVKNHRAERDRATVGGAQTETANNPAHPSFGKIVHVTLRGNSGAQADGLLTFFPDRLQFDSQDVAIRFPIDQVFGVDAAGARETFMLLHINPKSKISTAYLRYEHGYENGEFLFLLAPSDAIAPSLKLAEDYQQYAEAVRSGREQAIVTGGASTLPAISSSPSTGAPNTLPQTGSAVEKREIARYNTGFLERHNPSNKLVNGFKAITGIPGNLVVFDTGLGYVSEAQNPNVKPARQSFTQSGYLKFFVPDTAILGMRDVTVVRSGNTFTGSSNSSYIAEIDLDRNSTFFQQNKALMADSDQDNHLFFTFKDQYSLQRFLSSNPHASGARDSF